MEEKISRGLFFLASLFKTTEICLGSTKMDNFCQEKAYFTLRKVTFPPLKNISLMPLSTENLAMGL